MSKTESSNLSAIPDFSYLDGLDVTDKTKELPLRGISVGGKTPILVVKPATKDNPEYWSEMLVQVENHKNKYTSNDAQSVSSKLDDNRETDRVLYPKHVIVGWKNVVDGSGKPAEFTLGNCKAFINSIPGWLFDRVRDYCAEPSNFAQLTFEISEDSIKK